MITLSNAVVEIEHLKILQGVSLKYLLIPFIAWLGPTGRVKLQFSS